MPAIHFWTSGSATSGNNPFNPADPTIFPMSEACTGFIAGDVNNYDGLSSSNYKEKTFRRFWGSFDAPGVNIPVQNSDDVQVLEVWVKINRFVRSSFYPTIGSGGEYDHATSRLAPWDIAFTTHFTLRVEDDGMGGATATPVFFIPNPVPFPTLQAMDVRPNVVVYYFNAREWLKYYFEDYGYTAKRFRGAYGSVAFCPLPSFTLEEDGEWHHLRMVYDQTDALDPMDPHTRAAVWWDGVVVSEIDYTDPRVDDTFSALPKYSNFAGLFQSALFSTMRVAPNHADVTGLISPGPPSTEGLVLGRHSGLDYSGIPADLLIGGGADYWPVTPAPKVFVSQWEYAYHDWGQFVSRYNPTPYVAQMVYDGFHYRSTFTEGWPAAPYSPTAGTPSPTAETSYIYPIRDPYPPRYLQGHAPAPGEDPPPLNPWMENAPIVGWPVSSDPVGFPWAWYAHASYYVDNPIPNLTYPATYPYGFYAPLAFIWSVSGDVYNQGLISIPQADYPPS